jgi:hypothetical protein
MEMTRKSVLYALAVVVLMGTMAVGASAGDQEMNTYGYGPTDSSVSAQPDQGVVSPDAGEIREPMETGALPDGTVSEENGGYLNMDVEEQNSHPELWGRPNIQSGGGGE